MPRDLAGDELQAAAGGVVHHQAPHARAEHTALRLQVEYPFVVRYRRRGYAADFGRAAQQVLALAAHPCRRTQVQLVVRAPISMLDVHRRRLALVEVQEAKALRQHRAVGLDRLAVAPLETVARVVARQERALRLDVCVEHDRWNLLEGGRRVQLLSQPRADTGGAREIDNAHRGVRAKARRAGGLAREAEEHTRPQLHRPAADEEVVVREPHLVAVHRDVSVGRQQTQQLRHLRRDRAPSRSVWHPVRDREILALLDVAGLDRRTLLVEHRVVRGHVHDAATRLDAEQLVVGVGAPTPRRRERAYVRPVLAVPHLHDVLRGVALNALALAAQGHQIGGRLDRDDAQLPDDEWRILRHALVIEQNPRRRMQVI